MPIVDVGERYQASHRDCNEHQAGAQPSGVNVRRGDALPEKPLGLPLSFTHILQNDFVEEPGKPTLIGEINRNAASSSHLPGTFPKNVGKRQAFHARGVVTETYKQAWVRSIALLLDDDGQVHIQVDATVEMVGAGRVEWSNGHTLTGRVELQVVDDRCTSFSRWFDDVIHPGAIANDV